MRDNSQNRHSYNKSAEPEAVEVSAAQSVDAAVTEETVVEVRETKGIVTDCMKLNVREKPDADATVLTVIPALSEVLVDLKKSTDIFYKVCIATGVEGYCMKQFIAVQQ